MGSFGHAASWEEPGLDKAVNFVLLEEMFVQHRSGRALLSLSNRNLEIPRSTTLLSGRLLLLSKTCRRSVDSNPSLGTTHQWWRPWHCFPQWLERKENDVELIQLENSWEHGQPWYLTPTHSHGGLLQWWSGGRQAFQHLLVNKVKLIECQGIMCQGASCVRCWVFHKFNFIVNNNNYYNYILMLLYQSLF